MIKVYIFIGLLIGSMFGGWLVRGWYEGDKTKSAIEYAVEQANKQAKKDLIKALQAQQVSQALKKNFNQVKQDAQKTSLCSNGGRDFLGLFNKASRAANTIKTN